MCAVVKSSFPLAEVCAHLPKYLPAHSSHARCQEQLRDVAAHQPTFAQANQEDQLAGETRNRML